MISPTGTDATLEILKNMRRGKFLTCLTSRCEHVTGLMPSAGLRVVRRRWHAGGSQTRFVRIACCLAVIALCACGSGCRIGNQLAKTMVVEPLGYARFLEEKREHFRFRQLAECALAAEKSRVRAELDDYTCKPFSLDEQAGFLDGFVDYLDAGGTGNPPTLPPRRYWRTEHENQAGYQAVQDWYRGYAQGAAAAQASGYRELVTICTSDSLGAFREPYYPGQDHCLPGTLLESPDEKPQEPEPSRLVNRSSESSISLRLAERDAGIGAAPEVRMNAPLTPPAPPPSLGGDQSARPAADIQPMELPREKTPTPAPPAVSPSGTLPPQPASSLSPPAPRTDVVEPASPWLPGLGPQANSQATTLALPPDLELTVSRPTTAEVGRLSDCVPPANEIRHGAAEADQAAGSRQRESSDAFTCLRLPAVKKVKPSSPDDARERVLRLPAPVRFTIPVHKNAVTRLQHP